MEWSLFMGRGVGKWEGGKRSFTLINRGGQKSFNAEKWGEGSKKFLNLNTMSRVLISIITKEDSEKSISNDLETQNFQKFPCSVPTMVAPRGSLAH
jgi:hypothetical protein